VIIIGDEISLSFNKLIWFGGSSGTITDKTSERTSPAVPFLGFFDGLPKSFSKQKELKK
jgi:hypothetical protein